MFFTFARNYINEPLFGNHDNLDNRSNIKVISQIKYKYNNMNDRFKEHVVLYMNYKK